MSQVWTRRAVSNQVALAWIGCRAQGLEFRVLILREFVWMSETQMTATSPGTGLARGFGFRGVGLYSMGH